MTPGAPAPNDSSFSGGCLTVLGLPFALAGFAAAVKAVLHYSRAPAETQSILVEAVLALACGGVGIALMASGFAASAAKAKLLHLTSRNPGKPWLWRGDWARGYAEPDFKSTAAMMGGAGLLFLLVSLPGLLKLPHELFVRRQYLALLLLLFPLAGLLLLGQSLLAYLRDRKFRGLRFIADSFPGVLGGPLEGRIQSAFLLPAGEPVSVVLSCVRSYVSGGGKSRSRWETVLWQAKNIVPPAVGARGSDLAIAFEIPYDARSTDNSNPDDRIYWRISVHEDLPGVDLRAVFVVPVCRTADSDATRTIAQLESEEVVRRSRERPEDSQITLGVSPEGGDQLRLGAARNRKMAAAITFFGAVFLGGGLLFGFLSAHAFTWFVGAIPLAISGGVGVLLLLFACWLWFGTVTVDIVNREMHMRASCLGLSRTRVIPASEMRTMELFPGMSQGDDVWYDFRIHLADGETITAGSGMEKSEAEWYMAKIKADLGL